MTALTPRDAFAEALGAWNRANDALLEGRSFAGRPGAWELLHRHADHLL
jgi:hypothetical protein